MILRVHSPESAPHASLPGGIGACNIASKRAQAGGSLLKGSLSSLWVARFQALGGAQQCLAQRRVGILEGLAEKGRTIILTSHDPMVVESEVVDYIVTLRDGKIVDEK